MTQFENEENYLNFVKTRLLSLKDGWGDCVDNKAFISSHIDICINLIKRILNHLRKEQIKINMPIISVYIPNSIDIHWKEQGIDMLINSEDESTFHISADFKGKDYLVGHKNEKELEQDVITYFKNHLCRE